MQDPSAGEARQSLLPGFDAQPARTAGPRAGPRRPLAVLRYAGLALLGAIAALAGMGLVPPSEHSLGPVSVAASAHIGNPTTTLELPPVGAISAKTHDAFLAVKLAVTEVDPLAVGKLLSESSSERAIVDELAEAIQSAASSLALRLLAGGAILGGLVLALLPGRRWSWIAAGAVGGLIATAGLLALTWKGFSPEAFREPVFEGSLERAPQVIRAIQEQNVSFDRARSRVQGAAARLSRALTLLGQPVGEPDSGGTALLHIGDIHSNPLGLEFARELASRFKVDAVIDTGDLTSFGEPIEARIGDLVASIGVPYLFVPGNHDSPPIREAIGAIPNVVLLDGNVAEVGGVRIQGFADPAFTAAGAVSNEEHDGAVRNLSREVGASVERENPDVLAVHHPRLAGASLGEVPLVLAGHRHREASTLSRNTLVLEVGSSGATGLGSFLADIDLAYEAEIVYFRDGRATAYDYVTFRGLGSDFEIRRRTLEEQGPRSDSGNLQEQGSGEPATSSPVPLPTSTP